MRSQPQPIRSLALTTAQDHEISGGRIDSKRLDFGIPCVEMHDVQLIIIIIYILIIIINIYIFKI